MLLRARGEDAFNRFSTDAQSRQSSSFLAWAPGRGPRRWPRRRWGWRRRGHHPCFHAFVVVAQRNRFSAVWSHNRRGRSMAPLSAAVDLLAASSDTFSFNSASSSLIRSSCSLILFRAA
jgi:hypothetical protein